MSVLTLLHLNAQNVQLITEDLKFEDAFFKNFSGYYILGLPTPGLLLPMFQKMKRGICSQNEMDAMFRCSILRKKGNDIECQNLLHYCAQADRDLSPEI